MTTPESEADQPQRPQAPDKVSCRTCGRELPAEHAIRAEVEDYVIWFCGLPCHEAWDDRQRDDD